MARAAHDARRRRAQRGRGVGMSAAGPRAPQARRGAAPGRAAIVVGKHRFAEFFAEKRY
jgi:hypothetical protein